MMYVSLFVIVFSTLYLTCVIFRLHQKKRFSRGKNKKKEEVFYVSSSRASTKKIGIPIVIA